MPLRGPIPWHPKSPVTRLRALFMRESRGFCLRFLLLALLIWGAGPRRVAAKAEVVTVGTYLHNIEDIDLEHNNYELSFQLWMKWEGEIDPTASFRFTNLIEEWALTSRPVFPIPIVLPDGRKYQRFVVEGRFFHKFWLGTFPLDWQKVTLEVEDENHTTEELLYAPDLENSGIHPDLTIPGWEILEIYNESKAANYGSDFGSGLGKAATFPHYRFGVRIERPVRFYFLKIMPPIVITLLCCLTIFFVDPRYVDARLGTPIAVLLAEVFLQLSFTNSLPDVAILLLIDHLFNFSYTIIFLCLVVCIWTTRLVSRLEKLEAEVDSADPGTVEAVKEEISAMESRLRRIDRFAGFGLTAVFFLGLAAITFALRGGYLLEMLGR